MKKLFLPFCMMLLSQQVFAAGYSTANSWRWKNDAGDINATGWYAPVNKTPTISLPGPLRLRLSVNNSAGSTTSTAADKIVLQYRVESPANIDANVSPTFTAWKDIVVGDPSTSTEPIVINAAYAGPLVNNGTSTTPLITKTTSNNKFAPDDAATATNFVKAIALSKTNNASSTPQTISMGFYETEYRLEFTKKAVPGETYYFRQYNANPNASTYLAGSTDSWDYSAGYPSIVVSPDYMGTVNSALPNIRAQILTGAGEYFTGTPRNGNLRISNAGTVPSYGTISATVNTPVGWTFSIPVVPSGWSFDAPTKVISSNSGTALAAGAGQNFGYTMVNSAAGFASSFLQFTVDAATVDGDGRNNQQTSLVFKKL